MTRRDETWVFGYGSLIWRPGFEHVERVRARLMGYKRGFCMTSVHYRGTPEAPGLVLALDREALGRCDGVAYRLSPETTEATLAYLRDRELVSHAYDEAWLPLTLEDGRSVEAVTFVVNHDHAQYRGGLDLEAQADVIAHAVGPMGPNAEYLTNTIDGLAQLGLSDPDLLTLAALVHVRRAG